MRKLKKMGFYILLLLLTLLMFYFLMPITKDIVFAIGKMPLELIGLILIITALLIKLLPYIFKLVFIRIPEVQGAIVISKFSGRTGRILKEGLHFIWPWQYVRIFSLEKRAVKEITIDSIPTKDSTVDVKISYQYSPCINHLNKFVENDESMIQKGIEDMVRSFVGIFAASYNTKEVRTKWEELEKFVWSKFKEEHEHYDEYSKKNVKYTDLEDKYGVEIIRVAVTDIDLPKTVQEALEKEVKEKYFQEGEKMRWKNTLDRVKQIRKINPQISEKDALNAVQIERDKVKKQIIEIENLDEMAKKVTDSIVKLFKGEQK